ncbi:MAG TPA: hypothetical protein VMW16_01320 [Sedimentisphaerales bacterium]|nr:hypothetical protein [Sedimentisphaerales bacterium]
MKKLLILTLALAMAPVTLGQVTLKVCEADGMTPFDCNSGVMVGTSLTLIVTSDTNDYWAGGLFIEGQNRLLGTLAARDYDPNTDDWTGSHTENAGDFAYVVQWKDSSIWGFDMYTFYPVDGNNDSSTQPGDWFTIDYHADDVGDCNVKFYNYRTEWNDANCYVTSSHITIHNVPTRDLTSDQIVNFDDFAIFASHWNDSNCDDPNWCDGADLDRDGDVDYNDVELFVDFWLWPSSDQTQGGGGNPEPNEPNYPQDPNIIYSIVDTNDSNEITVDANTSVTLYVKMATIGTGNVSIFDIEVNISDPNLGSIDNRQYDPNDPNASTARILAEPRDEDWDCWGPGLTQPEGIEFYAVNLESSIYDGNLASFIFTCTGPGDVVLTLINYCSYDVNNNQVYPTLQSIVIHQMEAGSEQMMTGGEMLSTQESLPSDPADEPTTGELADWLEQLWSQEKDVRDTYTKTEWEEFINSVGNP